MESRTYALYRYFLCFNIIPIYVEMFKPCSFFFMFEPLFQIMLINKYNAREKQGILVFNSFLYLCGAQDTKVCDGLRFLSSQAKTMKSSLQMTVTTNTRFLQTTRTEQPQHFLKTRAVLMLIIMSNSYLPQHRHHRNPLIKPLKSPWHNSMICGWTSSQFLILLQCFIWVNILLTRSKI